MIYSRTANFATFLPTPIVPADLRNKPSKVNKSNFPKTHKQRKKETFQPLQPPLHFIMSDESVPQLPTTFQIVYASRTESEFSPPPSHPSFEWDPDPRVRNSQCSFVIQDPLVPNALTPIKNSHSTDRTSTMPAIKPKNNPHYFLGAAFRKIARFFRAAGDREGC